jgi:hypothetical protein
MLVVETITRIRREYRDRKPIEAIARDLGLSRNNFWDERSIARGGMRASRWNPIAILPFMEHQGISASGNPRNKRE